MSTLEGVMMTKYVYEFAEGNKDMKDLLGGKGANLAEMTNIGLPVPPGFTITTDACRAYLASGNFPDGMWAEIGEHLRGLELRSGRNLGDAHDPLLLSVRSGAKFSMPGMMETVLDIGLNDRSVEGLAARTGNDRFAWDSYRRLIQMFGTTVRGVDHGAFASVLDDLKDRRSAASDVDLDAADLRELVEGYKKVYREHTGDDFPQGPHEQLHEAVAAVFASWNTSRAELYRRQEHIPADLGTAVNVMAMVYGNLGADSGTGVAFTRDPATGACGV
jgi:pyruvate, orthophosphate dikinase